MAVPPQINPSWQTIDNVSLYPGQSTRINLRAHQSNQSATITLQGSPPNWVTLDFTGVQRYLNIAAPSSLTGGESYTITLRAVAIVSGSPVTRETSFTITILTPIAPTFDPSNQDTIAGVAWSLDVNTFKTAGEPTVGYAFAPSFTPPSWATLDGSTLSGTPPIADYTSPTNVEQFRIRGSNVAGHADFSFDLDIARAVAPGISSIAPQYATQDVLFTLDVSSHIAGSPTPTIDPTGLPSWLHVEGFVLSGTPTGFTANQQESVTLTVRNVVGSVSHTFALYIRVGSDTFTELTTGSPITVAHNNLRALAATETRIYYASSDEVGKVYATDHDGVAQSSETLTLTSANGGSTSIVEGLAVYGGNLYVLGGTSQQYVYKYRISDRSLVGTQNVSGPARGIAIPQIGESRVLAVLRTTGVVQMWSILFPGSLAGPLPAIGFTLSEAGVTNWQSLAYDTLDGKIYAGSANSAGAFLYAFNTNGGRDNQEAIQLNSANNDPRGSSYVDDTMYVAQANSGSSTGRVYIYNSIARVLPIPAQEGFDGEDWQLDLAPYLANAIDVTFKSGTTPPSWLRLSNNILSGTLPAVSRSQQDDVYNIQLTATHVDRTMDFTVQLTVKYVEVATWSSIPTVELDQAITPNIPSPNPPLVTTRTLHLLDHISNLSRAGTLTFSFENSEGIVNAALTTRTVNGVMINDVLTITAPATLPVENSPVASVNMLLRATNMVGRGDLNLAIDVTHLSLPRLQRLPAQSVNRNEIDTFNLASFATGMPTVFFALGTIQPRLTEAVATIISNANGMWSIHPNANLETLNNVFTVNVIASNRVGRADGSFQLTVHGVPHVDPNIAPTWHGTGLDFNINTGQTLEVDLSTLIATARPQPTYSIFSDSNVTDIGGTVSITGSTLRVTIPSDIDEAFVVSVEVEATNPAGSSEVPLMFHIMVVSAPVWSTIPQQRVRPGDGWTLDLNAYVAGMPTPTLSFNPAPAPGDTNAGATLTDGVLAWDVPATLTDDEVVTFHIDATNPQGTTLLSLGASVITDTAPVWTTSPIKFTVIEGSRNEEFDLSGFLTAGRPAPSLILGDNSTTVPANISFRGTTMLVTPTSNVLMDQSFTFDILARNSSGMASKSIELDINPLFEDNENIVLSENDYEEIRKLIDTQLTIQELPDEIIAADSIEGGAVAWALERMPIYPDYPRTLQELTGKRRAVIYRAAAILAASVRRSQDPRLTILEVNEYQLQQVLFERSEQEAEIAQKRFDELGLSDETLFEGVTFEVTC